ncbi:DNA polymerase III subunit delta' [Aquidulcibacter paucihalophilus]|uniref:DNA polymerase III subunit delta' n=1 Tax=Aquidulcibacter paucihalophilus TaxID=1978549 RepID=UPI000A19922F|nr:DNA polymerase III subunit delta' [Aquidulcibacter paucihalophilus]
MSEDAATPDQEPGSPHPRAVFELFGHETAEAELADSLSGGRSHHAWLITGPKGVGKATLAYRFARRLLGASPASTSPLASLPDDPISRKIAQGAHADLRTATRLDPEKGEIKRDVTVAAIRDLTHFFTMTSDGAGGVRVGIVDCADDMSSNAANALLKTLEEPPPGGTLILLAHAPGRLLPTLRSRCRRLDLACLSEDAMAKALPDVDVTTRALGAGRPGRARALAALNAAKLYGSLSRYLSGLPRAPLDEALALAEACSDADRFHAVFDMMEDWLARAGRAGPGLEISEIEPGESILLARLAAGAGTDGAAKAWSHVREVRTKVEALNLDRSLATLEALRAIRADLAPIH